MLTPAAPAPREAGKPEIEEARGEIRGMFAQVRQTLRDKSLDATRERASEVIAKARKVSLAAATRKQQAEEAARFARGENVAWPTDPSLLTVASRNGASTYACRHCRSELGAIRRTGDGLRVLAVAAGILARYREGGTLELTCPCGRISPVDWRGDRT